MIIFAAFLCIGPLGTCELQGGTMFRSATECEQNFKYQGYKELNGRFYVNDTMWYECRSKHVETWQPVR